MKTIYILLVIISSFTITGPIQPGNQYQVIISTDTLQYPIDDSCVAVHCYNNALQNLGAYNDQSRQMVTGVQMDTVHE